MSPEGATAIPWIAVGRLRLPSWTACDSPEASYSTTSLPVATTTFPLLGSTDSVVVGPEDTLKFRSPLDESCLYNSPKKLAVKRDPAVGPSPAAMVRGKRFGAFRPDAKSEFTGGLAVGVNLSTPPPKLSPTYTFPPESTATPAAALN